MSRSGRKDLSRRAFLLRFTTLVAATAAAAGSYGNLPRSWAKPHAPGREALQQGSTGGPTTALAEGPRPQGSSWGGEEDPDLRLGLSTRMSEYLALERQGCSCPALCACDWRGAWGYRLGA